MASTRGLAVYGDDVGLALAQGVDPRGEAGLEEFGVERIDHVVERVMRRKAPIVGQEAAQEVEPLPAPQPDLDEILHPAERRAQHDEQDFGQRSEEHTSELQSLLRISYAVFCLKKKTQR